MWPLVPMVVPSFFPPSLTPAVSGLPMPLPIPPTLTSVPPVPVPSVPVGPVPILPGGPVPPDLLPLLAVGKGNLLRGKVVLGYHRGGHGGSTGGVKGVHIPLKVG